MTFRLASGAGFVLVIGCNPSGLRSTGLGSSQWSGGPQVVWDIEALPLPEIPLPNDAATRYDATSATGRRLNISEEASTELERRSRRQFNRLMDLGPMRPLRCLLIRHWTWLIF